MPRQRILHPTFWEDPVIGRLPIEHQLLFLGVVSNADDEGIALGDPEYLKSTVFRYQKLSATKVKKVRDELADRVRGFHVYEVDGIAYIALLKWNEYQHPKYAKPTKFPKPSVNGTTGQDTHDTF